MSSFPFSNITIFQIGIANENKTSFYFESIHPKQSHVFPVQFIFASTNSRPQVEYRTDSSCQETFQYVEERKIHREY